MNYFTVILVFLVFAFAMETANVLEDNRKEKLVENELKQSSYEDCVHQLDTNTLGKSNE